MKKLTFILITVLAALCQTANASEASHWVDSVFNTLTPRQRVAQLFIPHLVIQDNQQGRQALRKLVAEEHVGGILLGKGTVSSYAALNGYAQSLAEVPLMITADAEWGLAMRLKDAPRFPHNIALGAGDDLEAMEQYGREKARELRAMGITVDFAPVVDVNSNPSNPVIGYRSFGEDPERVAALAKAFTRGLETGGVMAVAKHFPGHGDTSSDSHKTLPVVSRSRSELDAVELLPFKTLIDDGIGGVMVGHLNVPSIDKGIPASLSPKVINGLLKKELGFDGIVFTDALEMKGAKVGDGTNNCVSALLAGADVLLGPGNTSSDIDAVMAAIKSGRLSQKRVDESVRKVLTHKFYLRAPRKITTPTLMTEKTRSLMDALAEMSVTVVRDEDKLLPLSRDTRIAVIPVGGSATSFTEALPQSATVLSDAGADLGDYDVVVAPVVSSSSSAVAALTKLKEKAGRRLVAVMFMNPYKMKDFAPVLKGLLTVVSVGDDTSTLQRAAARGLQGLFEVRGHMPVSVSGVARVGDGVTIAKIAGKSMSAVEMMERTIDSLINVGLDRGAFPGCQIVVMQGGRIVLERAAGYISTKKEARVTPSTLYDLASVSKLAGTLVAAMKASDLLSTEDTLGRFIPDAGDKSRLTVRQLMTHRSGLPASMNPYRFAFDPDSYDGQLFSSRRSDLYSINAGPGMWGNSDARLRHDIFSRTRSDEFNMKVSDHLWASEAAADSLTSYIIRNVSVKPSKGYVYSDVNYLLLGDIVERATGRRLDKYLTENVYVPMDLDRICYMPLDLFVTNEIAATENDMMIRRQRVHGTVHDESAAVAGGVAGNAGLFANARSLAAVGQMLIDGGVYDGKRILPEKVVRRFMDSKIGFDSRDGGRWIGHTGFTGTCMWLDRKRDIVVVILTNRVNPSRENSAWKRLNFRNAVVDAVSEAL